MRGGPLLLIAGVERSNWSYLIPPGRLYLGRSAECQIRLADPTVSRVHAQITRNGHGLVIRDLQSCNGTFVNGTRVTEAHFELPAMLKLGRVTMEVVPSTDLEELLDVGQVDSTAPLADDRAELRETDPLQTCTGIGLTPGQMRVMSLLLQGLGDKELAARLHLSRHTIHAHIKNIFRAWDVHSRGELFAKVHGNTEIPNRLQK